MNQQLKDYLEKMEIKPPFIETLESKKGNTTTFITINLN